jgi:hypothetical protein
MTRGTATKGGVDQKVIVDPIDSFQIDIVRPIPPKKEAADPYSSAFKYPWSVITPTRVHMKQRIKFIL